MSAAPTEAELAKFDTIRRALDQYGFLPSHIGSPFDALRVAFKIRDHYTRPTNNTPQPTALHLPHRRPHA